MIIHPLVLSVGLVSAVRYPVLRAPAAPLPFQPGAVVPRYELPAPPERPLLPSRLFDGRRALDLPPAVSAERVERRPLFGPARRVTLPEQDLERELGLR